MKGNILVSELIGSDDRDFAAHYLKTSLKGIRVACALGAFLFLAFGFIVDTMVVQWMIRVCVIIPVLLTALLLSYTAFFAKYSQLILATSYLVIAVGLILMIHVTPDDASRDVYSTGLALVLFGGAVVRMRVKPLLAVTPVIICFYLILFIDKKELLIHIPLLVSASLLALISTNHTTVAMRKNFKTLQALENERAKLAASDAFKSKLISVISHDLKGPMNNVLSLIRLYNSGAIERAEIGRFFYDIEKGAHATKELLEDLLTWSVHKLKGDEHSSSVNCHDIVQRLMDAQRDVAAKKGNVLINNVPDWTIHTDPKLLSVVIRNLISNAIKFTSSGKISANAQLWENGIRLTIADTGKGISKEVISRLFDWNRRFTSPGTSGEKGTGLGLLICRDFLDSVGGQVLVESVEGKETKFHVFIPTMVKESRSLVSISA